MKGHDKSEADKTNAPQEPATDNQTVEPEDEATKPDSEKTPGKFMQHLHRAKEWYRHHLRIAIPSTVLALALLIAVVPFLRYNILGLFISKNYSMQVIDSETKSPVSGALVTIGSIHSETDGNGKAVLHVKVGKHSAHIVKKYYTDASAKVTAPVLSEKKTPQILLSATGRQVKIDVINTISKKPVAQATIKVADITAKTDSNGNAMIVLPPGVPEQGGTLSANGYNDASVKIKVSDTAVAENKFTISPTGKIYFLSKRTGKIDVMKSNLDGSDQSVVLAGTGTEDDSDTILLASRDWKFLAFKSKRDSGPAKLYYIDTSVDKLNTLDEGNAEFTMIGWAGDTFVYQVHRLGMQDWQPNQNALKSFNATNSKLTLLNQSSAVGTNSGDSAYEIFGSSYIIDSTLIFDKTWQGGNSSVKAGKNASIYSVNVDGSGSKTLKDFAYTGAPNNYIFFGSLLYEPREIYYQPNINGAQSYYKYENGSLNADSSIADGYNKATSQAYPTYLLSPSGKQTFWVEPRDGKNAFLVGDQEGQNSKVVASISTDYLNYGWYSDDYLFVSKKSSELYVLPSTGIKVESDLIKITDYHKPAYFFYGYGGGYGGL